MRASVRQVTLTAYMLFLALRAGLEVEWTSVEKPLRKTVKKFVRNGNHDSESDQEMSEAQIADDESVERYMLLGIHVTQT